MIDASSLKLVKAPAAAGERPATRAQGSRRVISIGGGKGGIGKSFIATNLAIEFARRGQKVMLIDADLGGANLHTCLGIGQPRKSLSDFLEGRVDRIEDVVVPSGIPNLGIVSGAMDGVDAANPEHGPRMRLLRHIQGLDFGQVVVDVGAGTHPNVLDFFLLSDHGILVLVPEPTAVENVYRFVKAAFWRRARNAVAACGFEPLLRSVMQSAFKSPAEIIAALSARSPHAGAILSRHLERFRPRLLVNQTRTPQDVDVGNAVVAVWRKFFGLDMDYLGHIQHDPEMWRTMRARRPLLVHSPAAPAAKAFAQIADRLSALDAAHARSEGTK